MSGEAFGLGKPEAKARLAALGQTLHPEAKVGAYERPEPGKPGNVVVLDRVTPGGTPPYCTHGYVACVHCDELCWLGCETEKIVTSGKAFGLCLECARKLITPEMMAAHHVERVHDHLRADGPHE